MGARAPARSRDRPCLILSTLSSAFSEWCLIAFLFFTATLSYLAIKFARFCDLQAPCLFCSRLDHILGRPWFYGDLVCSGHRLQISCLTYCQGHHKLVYIHDLCESCLLWSATLADKRGEVSGHDNNVHPKQLATSEGDGSKIVLDGEDLAVVPLLQMDTESSCPSTRQCLCCARPLKRTTKRKEKNFELINVTHSKDHNLDHLSQVGYTKLKISSDSEAGVPISDEDEMTGNSRMVTGVKNEAPQIINVNRGSSRTSGEDLTIEKPIDPARVIPVAIVADSKRQPNAGESSVESSSSVIWRRLEEMNWCQVNVRNNHAALPEVVSEQMPEKILKERGMEEIDDSEFVLDAANGKITKSPSSVVTKKMNSESSLPTRIRADRNDGLKRVLSNRGGCCQSPRPSEIISARDDSRTRDDLKALFSNLSSSRAFDGPRSEMSPTPRLSTHADDVTKASDASSSTGVQIRSNSGLESLDVSLVGEIGENSVDLLKYQVEFDKKSMNILYKELEAERSASAVAVNQTMAMINRLQEEKAAMQMDALQYLRIMEEQAEYDEEAIQKLNNLLTEREKAILDLEAELNSYKKRYGDDLSKDQTGKTSDELNGSGSVKNPLVGFEDEKAYISECLSRLEKKINQSRINAAKTGSLSNDAETISLVPSKNTQLMGQGNHDADDIAALKHEISHLNERFKAFEADQKLLQCVFNSFENSSEGVQFIQEIADHLHELRRTVVK